MRISQIELKNLTTQSIIKTIIPTSAITDIDGISKLASTSPLEVIKDENIIQVYTKARYSIGGISIPYYFLDDNNKASGMQKIAETWIGTPATGESSKVGDVISYANEETKLLNGNIERDKIISDVKQTFIKSVSLYCVISYLLGIKYS